MLTLFFSTLIACSTNPKSDHPDDTPDDQNEIPEYFNQSLVLVDYDNFDPVSEHIEVSFEAVEADGIIYETEQVMNFSASCNSMFAPYYMAEDTFVMVGLGTTYILCEDDIMLEEQWLVEFFDSEPSMTYDNEQLIFEGSESTLVFEVAEPETDVDLVDTEWSVVGFEEGDIMMALSFDVVPSFVFSSDMTFSLETGCNTAMGAYELFEDDRLFVEIDSITDAVCPDEIAQEGEDLVMSVFNDALLSVSISGSNLSLINEAGRIGISAAAE